MINPLSVVLLSHQRGAVQYANQGYGVDPLGETAKLPTVPRAELQQGVSASFRRFPPLRAIVGKGPIS